MGKNIELAKGEQALVSLRLIERPTSNLKNERDTSPQPAKKIGG